MKARGLSILEAVTALFILAGATLVVVAVFHSGMRRQAQIDDRQLALGVAQRQLEQLREQSRSWSGFRNLAGLDGMYRPDSQLPLFEVASAARLTSLFSPCSSFAEDQRLLEKTASWVTVAVRWPRSGDSVRLTGLMAEPLRPLDPTPHVRVMAMTPIANPMPRNSLGDLRADLVDANGDVVDGVRFTFWVKPKTANVKLKRRRDGKRTVVVNQLEPPQFPADATAFPAGESFDQGDTVIMARGRYHGASVTGYSDPITLEP